MIPFGPWLPDIAQFTPDAAFEALNVIPGANGYTPFTGFSPITAALPSVVKGAASFRSSSGVIYNVAGTDTKLYLLDSGGLTYSDVTRTVGGDYGLVVDERWSFTQFGDYIIANNPVDVPQYFNMGASTKFAALAGSPPISQFVGNVRDFVVMARHSSNFAKLSWSGINNPTQWTISSATMSDEQTFPDGGIIMGFVGGEFGVVFLERAVYRMSFEGPPLIFRFDKISQYFGLRSEGSLASYNDLIFGLSDDGFMMMRGGAEIIPIGTEKVDRWFEANADPSWIYRMTSTVDPVRKIYLCAFVSNDSPDGFPDQAIIYHWPTGKWSRVMMNIEMISSGATQQTYTIDGLDTVAATIDEIPYPVDSRFWAGAARLMLNGFSTDHQMGYFQGPNLSATVETGDMQLTPGRKSLLRGLRPMVEGMTVTPSLSIKYRDRLQDGHSASAAVDANAYGMCPVRVNARYHRAKVDVPAGSDWTFATGVDDMKFSAMGAR